MKHFLIAATLACVATTASAQQTPMQAFFTTWDLNSDGKVTHHEATQVREQLFKTFDVNKNRYLSAEEFDALNASHVNGGFKKADRGLSLTYNDVDRDGQVSKDEFVSQMSNWFAFWDSDDDNFITADDFARPRPKKQ